MKMNETESEQVKIDRLLEDIYIKAYGEQVGVDFKVETSEEDMKKYSKKLISTSGKLETELDLIEHHSEYDKWVASIASMDDEMVMDLYNGYLVRMNNKEEMMGRELIQRHILAPRARKLREELLAAVKAINEPTSPTDYLYGFVILIAIIGLIALFSAC